MTTEEETSELISRFKEGDKSAFDKIVMQYEKDVYRICFRFFQNNEDALDATQESFVKVFRNLCKFEGRSSFKTWLYRISSNVCLTISQKKKREKEGLLEVISDWFSGFMQKNPEEEAIDELTGSFDKKAVEKAISGLPENYRMPVILKDIEGMPMEKISDILEIPVGTVKSRLNRGRALLHENLEDYVKERFK